MILLSELLATENPKHRVEQVMLITEYECGCHTTITYAGQPYLSSRELNANNGSLWSDSSHCNKNHSISFEEIDCCENISPKNVATEILAGNSIAISSEIKMEDCKNKKGKQR